MFSVLLIIGGDVIQLALGAVTGSSPVTPIAFSFGWVAYAMSAVVSAVGGNHLMPTSPEISVKGFNLRSGYQRANQSWLLGRLVKTYDYWMPKEVKELSRELKPSLCITVYKWRKDGKPGVPARDLVWWSAFLVSVVQLGVAAIPFGVHKDWSIFLATACGTALCYKWHARTIKKDVALTTGNGSKHVIIILGADHGLDLEDLAAGRTSDLRSTRFITMVLAVLWLVLLITCIGIKTNTWYLLAIGGLGMLHNIVVAEAPRLPAAMGFPIEVVTSTLDPKNTDEPRAEVFSDQKVMWTLMALEEKFGQVLVPEFFPGKLREWETTWWAGTDYGQKMKLLQKAKEDEREKTLKKNQEKVAMVNSIPV